MTNSPSTAGNNPSLPREHELRTFGDIHSDLARVAAMIDMIKTYDPVNDPRGWAPAATILYIAASMAHRVADELRPLKA